MKRSNRIPLSNTFTALAAIVATSTLVAGCSDQPEEAIYCVDENNVIQDVERCDGDDSDDAWDSGHSYFIWTGHYPTNIRPGTKLDASSRTRAFSHTDTTSRTSVGLPARGGFGTYGKAGSTGG